MTAARRLWYAIRHPRRAWVRRKLERRARALMPEPYTAVDVASSAGVVHLIFTRHDGEKRYVNLPPDVAHGLGRALYKGTKRARAKGRASA